VFGTSNLLSEPLHHIMMEVNELKSREAAIRSAGHYPPGPQLTFRLQRTFDAGQVTAVTTTAASTTMWVDKYRPKKFSDLLGEEVSCVLYMKDSPADQVACAPGRYRLAKGMGQVRV